jgi:PST family polysaccharide transporter
MISPKKFLQQKDRRQLFYNFMNYGFFQASNYLIPLITIPYIIRVVGLEKFGIISLAQSVIFYIRVAVDYGWSVLGVQYIAKAQTDNRKKSEVVSNIFTIQFALTFVGILVLFILFLFIGTIHEEWIVFFAFFGLVPANMMIAPWFYLGMEKVKFMNYINLTARLLYLLLIFGLLRNEGQYIWVPVFNSTSMLIGGLISLTFIISHFKIKLRIPSFRRIKQYLIEGWPIFTSIFATNFYRNSNILILAIFASNEIVGIYAAAEKVVKVVQGIFAPITQTVYPYISRISAESHQKARNMVKRLTFYMILMTSVVVVGLIISSDLVVKLLLDHYNALGSTLLRIGSFVVLFGMLNYILGIIYMTNFGMKKQFMISVFITGIANIIVCFILSKYFNAVGAMVAFSFAEFLLLGFLIWHISRFSESKISVII